MTEITGMSRPKSKRRAPDALNSQTILLVEDSPTQALRTRTVLEAAGFGVKTCESGAAAIEFAAAEVPDLVLLDMHLPDLSGWEVAQRLKGTPGLAQIPIIFLSGVFREVDDILRGLNQGADDYLCKPVEDEELVARVKASLRTKMGRQAFSRLVRLALTVNQLGNQLAGAADLQSLLNSVVRLLHDNFDYPHVYLFLVEAEELTLRAAAGPGSTELMASQPRLPINSGGDNLAGVMNALTTGVPLVAKAAPEDALQPWLPKRRSRRAALLRSAGQLSGVLEIVGPATLQFDEDDQVILQTLADLVGVATYNAQIYRELETLATEDSLTRLFNRRKILARLDEEWARAQRYQRSLALICTDIDYFKAVNDTHGHATGDRALRSVADRIQRSIRDVDMAGRIGGDEFLIILPETDRKGALEVAERLRQRCADLVVETGNGTTVSLTLSLGTAGWPDTDAAAPGDLVRAADEALYRAKSRGRNCVSA